MSRVPYKHPSVFVACQYSPAPMYKALKEALNGVPFEFHYADSAIKTAHVLHRIRSGIVKCDFGLFDITDWNANVTLELGLAEGLNKNYYILFKPGRGKKKEPPSDIKGLQRIEYTSLDGYKEDSLTYKLNHQLARNLTHPRYIYDQLSGPTRDKAFILAMRMLAHFKNHKTLQRKDITPMVRGSHLRESVVDEVLQVIHGRKMIVGRLDGIKWKSGRDLYKHVTF